MYKMEQLKNIFKEKKYVFINIDTITNNKNNANINLPMEYKATIYENAQGMIFIRILGANDRTIFRKTSKNLDDIIKVLNDYMI
jgi:hypothetical protein